MVEKIEDNISRCAREKLFFQLEELNIDRSNGLSHPCRRGELSAIIEMPKQIQFFIHSTFFYIALCIAFVQAFFLSKWKLNDCHFYRRLSCLYFFIIFQIASFFPCRLTTKKKGFIRCHCHPLTPSVVVRSEALSVMNIKIIRIRQMLT